MQAAHDLYDGREGQDEREHFRDMIHDKVDKWIDELMVVFEKDRQPTLMELSDLFTATRHELLLTGPDRDQVQPPSGSGLCPVSQVRQVMQDETQCQKADAHDAGSEHV